MTSSPNQTLSAARRLIAAAVTAHTNVRNCHEVPRSTVQGTTVLLVPVPTDDDIMGRPFGFELDAILLVPQSSTQWAEKLDAFIWGERSLTAALDRDRPTIQSAHLNIVATSWGSYGIIEWAGDTYWSVTQRISVLD